MEITWRVISGAGMGENEGKGTTNKKHKQLVQNRQGRLRIVWEMEKPKKLHGGRGYTGQRGIKGRKKMGQQ